MCRQFSCVLLYTHNYNDCDLFRMQWLWLDCFLLASKPHRKTFSCASLYVPGHLFSPLAGLYNTLQTDKVKGGFVMAEGRPVVSTMHLLWSED